MHVRAPLYSVDLPNRDEGCRWEETMDKAGEQERLEAQIVST